MNFGDLVRLGAALTLGAASTACGDDDSSSGGGGSGGTGACADLACGLVHAYRFDQPNQLADQRGSADAVSVKASSYAAAGRTDAARTFDTTANDLVRLPDGMLDPLESMTVCVWFSPGGSGEGSLFSWHNDSDGGNLALNGGPWWSVGNTVTGGSLGAETWQLLCGVTGGPHGIELYVGTTLVGDDPGGAVINAGASPAVAIGADVSAPSASPKSHFDGLIDELYIWDRPLEAADVASVYSHAGASFW